MRLRTILTTLAVVTCLLTLSGSAWSTEAAKPSPPGPLQVIKPPAVTPATEVLKDLKLKSTTSSFGNQILLVSPGVFTAINSPTSVSCPAKSTSCTIEADQNVEATGSVAGQAWTICTQVDGVFMPECPFIGDLVDDNFGTGSFVSSMSGLKSGGHTLQTFVLVGDPGAYIGDFTIDYRVYTN